MADPVKNEKAKVSVGDKIAAALYDLLKPKEKEQRKKAEARVRMGPPPDTFQEMMQSDAWQERFEEWTITKLMGESFHFYCAVDAYKTAPSVDALVDIVTQFVTPGAPQVINIDPPVAKPLIDAMQDCLARSGTNQAPGAADPELFDEAYGLVESMLNSNVYIAFCTDVRDGFA